MRKKNQLFLVALLTAASALLSSIAWAETCTLNGHNAPMECIQGLRCKGETGTLICTKNGKPHGEWQIVDGKHVGFEKTYAYDGSRYERSVDEKGLATGLSRKYSPQGVLLDEREFSHDVLSGKLHQFYTDGNPNRTEWWANGKQEFSVAYTERGQIIDLRCGNQHYIDEDIALCGFGGKPVTINKLWGMNGTEDVTYLNGVLVKTHYHPN